MTGQTQRAGPWESNLGLEPEWDGASGLFWPVECEQFPEDAKYVKFSGSIEHREHKCSIKLFTNLSTKLIRGEESITTEPELIEPSLWHAHVALPNELGVKEVISITVLGHLFRGGLRLSSQASGLLKYQLAPLWIIQGAHISSIIDCQFDNMILKTNTLPGLLPDRILAYFFLNQENEEDHSTNIARIDIKAFEKANTGNFAAKIQSPIGENTITLQCSFKKQIGASISYEPSDEVRFNFPQPIPILNDAIEEPTPLTCLWNWADWLNGMIEMIGNTPTSSAIINTVHQEQRLRLYLNLRLARQEHSLDKVANKIRLDPVDEQNTTSRWNFLLQKWLNAWDLDSNWFIAVDYLRNFLRLAGEASPSMVPYFLSAVQCVEARWFAEFGEFKEVIKDEKKSKVKYKTQEIVKSTLDRADIITAELENSVGDDFNTETMSKVITTIRNEFTHPATKNKRTQLRELLWSIDSSDVYFLAELLVSAALKLIKQEVFTDNIYPIETNRNEYIEEYDNRYRLHIRNWRQLKRACSA